MDYMVATETITPEIELKARDLVGTGYQRILTFECASGGFNWWEGDDPGNALLTALVINMLTDSKKVTYVDDAVIKRTQDWLVERQQSDGSWTEETHLHAGNENLGAGSLRATSYIAWCLAHSGYDGAGLTSAVNYIHQQVPSEDDLYTLAMAVNAMAVANPSDPQLSALTKQLHDAAIEGEGGLIHWSAGESTMVGGGGNAADIETTALVGLALLHASAYPTDVEGAISWLIANKDPQGNWGYSTQATVLTLKLLVESLTGDAGATDADILVTLGGELAGERHFDDFNKDVLWQVDLSDLAIEGENSIELHYSGIGGLMWQIVDTHYIPWTDSVPTTAGPLTIDVAYDKTQLAVDDTVTVTVTVTNSDPNQDSMVLVDLGLPPGFELNAGDLATLREEGTISEYEFTDKQLLIYLDAVPVEAPVSFSYRLTALFPLEAQAPSSQVYPYYNQEQKTQSPPVDVQVN